MVPSHSRPHVSNDNLFSEAQFKTLKYRPNFPDRTERLNGTTFHVRRDLDPIWGVTASYENLISSMD